MKGGVQDYFALFISLVQFVKLHDDEFYLVDFNDFINLGWLRNTLVVSLLGSIVVDTIVSLSVDSSWLFLSIPSPNKYLLVA